MITLRDFIHKLKDRASQNSFVLQNLYCNLCVAMLQFVVVWWNQTLEGFSFPCLALQLYFLPAMLAERSCLSVSALYVPCKDLLALCILYLNCPLNKFTSLLYLIVSNLYLHGCVNSKTPISYNSKVRDFIILF